MLLLFWLACAKAPLPSPLPPATAPGPAMSSVDGWFLLQRAHDALYVDLLGPQAQALAAEAVARAQGPQLALDGPPADANAETTRRFLATFHGTQRPLGFAWAADDGLGALHAVQLEVRAAVPTLDVDENLVLRVWVVALDVAVVPESLLTRWDLEPQALTGGRQRHDAAPTCSQLGTQPVRVALPVATLPGPHLCTAMPLPDGEAWVATEQFYGVPLGWTGSCVSAELRRATGGRVPMNRACWSVASPTSDHALLYGISAIDSGPRLPVAWFAEGDRRWWVLNHTLDGGRYRCLAAEPDPGTNFDLSTCPQHR